MFRKGNKKSSHLKKREAEHADRDSVEEDDDDLAVQSAVRRALKKQKILSSMPLTSVGGSVARPINGFDNERTNPPGSSQQKQQLPCQESSELSVLASKHRQNMEDFIEKKIGISDNSITDNNVSKKVGKEEHRENANEEESLYQKLSKEVFAGNQSTINRALESPKDEDKGAGGAVLVGSGIAEVILPVQQRLASLNSTSNASGLGNRRFGGVIHSKNSKHEYPSSAVPEEERHSLTVTTPSPYGRNLSSFFPQNESQGAKFKQQSTTAVNDKNGGADTFTVASNSDSHRAGFDGFRGKLGSHATTSDKNEHHQQQVHSQQATANYKRNRDDHVFSNFVHRHFESSRR